MHRSRTGFVPVVAVVAAAVVLAATVAGALAAAFEARGDTYQTPMDTLLSVPAPGVLLNDGESGGVGLAVLATVSGPSHGTLRLNVDGSFEYTPNTGFLGSDSFSYESYDGEGSVSNVAVVTITVVTAAEPEPDPEDPDCAPTAQWRGQLKRGELTVNAGKKVQLQVAVDCDGHVGGLSPVVNLFADGASSPSVTGVMTEDDGKYQFSLGVPKTAVAGDVLVVVVRPYGDATAKLEASLHVRR